jgi:primosomal protein DnaI
MKEIKELAQEMKKDTPTSFADSILASLSKDPKVAEKIHLLTIGSSEAKLNLGLLTSYSDDCHYCANCPGYDKCAKDHAHYQMDIVRNDGLLDRTYGLCAPALKREQTADNYIYRDFPDEWLSVELSSLPRSDRSSLISQKFMEAQKDRQHPWLYVQGSLGVGKSYLLAALSNSYVQGHSVAFINSLRRFDELTGLAIKNRPEFDRRLEQLETCAFLVIDDFGTEYRKDYMRDQILLPLLTERAKSRAVTCFASSYSIDEMQELYSFNKGAAILARQLCDLIRSNVKAPIKLEKSFDAFLSKK